MTVIPAIDNYLNEYYFVVSSVYLAMTHYLVVIVPSSQADGLYLDGSFLHAIKKYSVPDPFSNFSVIITNINVGFHELKHADSTVMFGATMYGLGINVGYGFPVGFSFRKGNNLIMILDKNCIHCTTTLSSSPKFVTSIYDLQ